MQRRIAVEGKEEVTHSCDESTPSCEGSNHRYKLNFKHVSSTLWQVDMLNPPTIPQTKMLAPTSNLT
jgi:hypothetical protein